MRLDPLRDRDIVFPARMKSLTILLVTAALYGQPAAKPREEPSRLPVGPGAVEEGRQLFAGACSACHGPNGEGGHGPSLVDGWQVRRASDDDLFNAIKKGVPGTDMPPSSFPDDKIRLLAAFVRSLSRPAISSAVTGDAAAGREIFFGKGGCSACHMIRGQGGFPGPDLSGIGTTRTLRQLRESLLDPSARISPTFRAVTATTSDGRE